MDEHIMLPCRICYQETHSANVACGRCVQRQKESAVERALAAAPRKAQWVFFFLGSLCGVCATSIFYLIIRNAQ